MYTFIAGVTPALSYAMQHLQYVGIPVTDQFRWDVTHLLLDVPSFRPDSRNLNTILAALPKEVTVWGGNLNHPMLTGYRCIDLLKDEEYLCRNAAITADCAISLVENMVSGLLSERRVLIIGWGRIGKCLASRLRKIHCDATVAARNKSDRSRLDALNFQTVDTSDIMQIISEFDIIINTVPAEVLNEEDMISCRDCLKIDLASRKGIAGDDVVWARGLPGKNAPEQSGQLIAETFLRILKEDLS